MPPQLLPRTFTPRTRPPWGDFFFLQDAHSLPLGIRTTHTSPPRRHASGRISPRATHHSGPRRPSHPAPPDVVDPGLALGTRQRSPRFRLPPIPSTSTRRFKSYTRGIQVTPDMIAATNYANVGGTLPPAAGAGQRANAASVGENLRWTKLMIGQARPRPRSRPRPRPFPSPPGDTRCRRRAD